MSGGFADALGIRSKDDDSNEDDYVDNPLIAYEDLPIIGNLKFDMDDLGDGGDPWDESTKKININPYWGPVSTCECGASKTPNPNCHSHWCPMFKDPMGGKK